MTRERWQAITDRVVGAILVTIVVAAIAMALDSLT